MQKVSLFLLMISLCVNMFHGSTIESKHMNDISNDSNIILDMNDDIDNDSHPTNQDNEKFDEYKSLFDELVGESIIPGNNKFENPKESSIPSIDDNNTSNNSVPTTPSKESNNSSDTENTEPNNNGSNEQEETCPTQPSVTEPPKETEPPATEPTQNPEDNKDPTENAGNNTTQPTTPPQQETEPPTTENEQPTEPSPTVPPTPKPCTTHNYIFESTQVVNEYELCNYVKDVYKCTNCGSLSAEMHLTSAGLSSSELRSIANNMVHYVNSLRRDNGLCELWTSGDWNSWADTRSKELLISYGHSRPNGGSWMNSIGNNFTVGENIAFGQYSGYDFYSAFCNSGSHRATMLEPSAVGIAISISVDDNGNAYCAMILISQY